MSFLPDSDNTIIKHDVAFADRALVEVLEHDGAVMPHGVRRVIHDLVFRPQRNLEPAIVYAVMYGISILLHEDDDGTCRQCLLENPYRFRSQSHNASSLANLSINL